MLTTSEQSAILAGHNSTAAGNMLIFQGRDESHGSRFQVPHDYLHTPKGEIQ